MEDEEGGTRGLLRPVGAVSIPLQNPEQAGRRLLPVVECPLHGFPGKVVTRARKGADGGLDIHACSPPSLPAKRAGRTRSGPFSQALPCFFSFLTRCFW